MKSLPTLIRLKQRDLDERRRLLARLEQEAAAVAARITALENELAEESRKANESDQPAYGFGDYLLGTRQRRIRLETELHAVNERMQPVQDQVAEAYQELKRFELAQQGIEQRAKAAADKREQAVLDEAGLSAFRRQQNS